MPTRCLISKGYRKYKPDNRFSFTQMLILCVFVIIMLALGLHTGSTSRTFEEVQVLKVLDGDTIIVKSAQDKETTVRLLGVDTPETQHPNKPVECYGKEASNFAKNQLEGKVVELEYDLQTLDKYDRTLAYVYLDSQRFNDMLVGNGYATILNISPNDKYAHELLMKETDARTRNLGLWGQCN